MRHLLVCAFSILAGFVAESRSVGDGPACQDTNNIRWFTPGKFDDARKAADGNKRLLLIKGVAFGIDEIGAVCATKGCW